MPATKVATIRVREVGQRFGCLGEVVASNHRVVAQTRIYPYGSRSLAYQDAYDRARELGYVVDEEVAS